MQISIDPFQDGNLDLNRVEYLFEEAQLEGVSLDSTSLEYSFRKALERLAKRLAADPSDFGMLQRLEAATTLVSRLPFEVDLWKVQNICYEMLQTVYEEYQVRAQQGHEEARTWLRHFNTIAQNLTVQSMIILFALAALRSVPHRKRHLRQAGSQFRGRSHARA